MMNPQQNSYPQPMGQAPPMNPNYNGPPRGPPRGPPGGPPRGPPRGPPQYYNQPYANAYPVAQGQVISPQTEEQLIEKLEENLQNDMKRQLTNELNPSGTSTKDKEIENTVKKQMDRINGSENFLKQGIISAIAAFNKSNQIRNLTFTNSRGVAFRNLFIKKTLLDLYKKPDLGETSVLSATASGLSTLSYKMTPKFFRNRKGGKKAKNITRRRKT
jgi:hypothetical protein